MEKYTKIIEKLFDEKEMTQFLNSGKIIYKKIAKTNLPNDLEYDKKFSLVENRAAEPEASRCRLYFIESER